MVLQTCSLGTKLASSSRCCSCRTAAECQDYVRTWHTGRAKRGSTHGGVGVVAAGPVAPVALEDHAGALALEQGVAGHGRRVREGRRQDDRGLEDGEGEADEAELHGDVYGGGLSGKGWWER